MSSVGGATIAGNRRLQLLRHIFGFIDGERGLHRIRHPGLVGDGHGARLVQPVDDHDAVSSLADRSHDFLVIVVAEQEDGASRIGVAANLLMHLGDQRAGGVDETQIRG